MSDDIYAQRGAPSFVWRAGQERRLAMIRRWTSTRDAMILVDGCGLGAYAAHLLADTPSVYAFDIEYDRALATHERVPHTHVAAAEMLPYLAGTFDVILSHEVLEHVRNDQAALAEMARTLKVGGRAVIFCPNRWYPFETHGHYWRGQYHFGNTPLVNYLPDVWRNKLAPHVRTYTLYGLKRLLDGLPLSVVHHTRIFGGYDNIIAHHPRLGRMLRWALHAAEKTPLRVLGLSHLLVVEKVADLQTQCKSKTNSNGILSSALTCLWYNVLRLRWAFCSRPKTKSKMIAAL